MNRAKAGTSRQKESLLLHNNHIHIPAPFVHLPCQFQKADTYFHRLTDTHNCPPVSMSHLSLQSHSMEHFLQLRPAIFFFLHPLHISADLPTDNMLPHNIAVAIKNYLSAQM